MIDKNDALFLVRLPFGKKTIPYEDVLELIAAAKPPGYDPEGVMFELSVIQEDDHLKAAVLRGEVEVLDESLHRIGLPFIGRLERTVLTVRALREYVESIQGFLEVVEATEPQAAPATDTATPAPVVSAGASDGVEPANAGPLPIEAGLLTKEIADTFAGVNKWSADRWPRNLSASKWLHPARMALGCAGGASSVWNPLTLAQLMHSKAKGSKPKEQLMKSLNFRFNQNPVLKPWRDAFNEYFATYCVTD